MPSPEQTPPQPPAEARPARARKTDESAKVLFIAPVVEDMLRATAPALSAALDLEAIAASPAEFIKLDRAKRVGDAVFQVPFRQAGVADRRRNPVLRFRRSRRSRARRNRR